MPTVPKSVVPSRCPCGSGEPYAACCGPLHRGRATGLVTAPTAERLMRSRYSAFALGEASYLLLTWHPSTRPPALELDPALEWRRLEIVGTTAGAERDLAGTVAFVAHYRDAASGRAGRQDEDSTFRREAGQWFYVGPVAATPRTRPARRAPR
jgi:SEC-C motif-containing protein